MTRIAALLLLLAFAPVAEAQNAGEIAVLACKNAIARKVRAERAAAGDVRVAPGPRVTQTSGRATTVEGAGQYFDRTSREWRDFTWDCTYNASSGSVRVSVRYGAGTGGGGP